MDIGKVILVVLATLIGIILLSVGVNVLFSIDFNKAFGSISCIVAGIEFVISAYKYPVDK